MPKIKPLPYIWIVERKDGGAVRRSAYYRRAGQRIAINSAEGRALVPGDKGFLDAYGAAASQFETAKPARPGASTGPRNVANLVRSYMASDAYHEKAASTQAEYRRVMGEIVTIIGPKSVAAIGSPHVQALRDQFGGKKTPSRANKAVALVSVLLEHARRDLGWVNFNAALRPKKLRTGPGFLAWKEADLAQFMASPDVIQPIKIAAALAFFTGLRVGDLWDLPRSAYQDGCIAVTPKKTSRSTRATLLIPVHPALAAFLDAAPASDAPTVLTRADGKSWGYDNLKHHMTKAVRAAKLRRGLSFHGLRKYTTTTMAEAGLGDATIEALQPHADSRITALYRRSADQRRLAVLAVATLPHIRLQIGTASDLE